MDDMGGDPGASLTSGSLASRLDALDQLLYRAGEKFPFLGHLLQSTNVNGRGLLLALLALLLILILPPFVERTLRRLNHLQTNFRGEAIPQSMGLPILLVATLLLLTAGYLQPAARPETLNWLIAVVGFGGLGLLDDTRGNRKIRGLRGHFRAAFRDRHITTGFIKAVSGLGLALLLGLRLHENHDILLLLLDAALIALCANAVNLFDLRPGRAGSVFLLLALPLLWFEMLSHRMITGVPCLLFVFLPALRVWERDAKGKVMLGDTGSNLLGASLGLSFAQSDAPVGTRCLVLLLLIALHLLAERASLTTLIEKNAVLRFLDRLTGIR